MNKTILITGSSSGIGKATAKLFAKKGWNVVATMRSPEKENELNLIENILLEKVDVTDSLSINNAIQSGIKQFGNIDVIVNNAGYGLTGPFETASEEDILKQFETNVFGVFNVTRGILPHFRGQGYGTIINVTSMGGKLTLPLYSLYHSTKFAVEGFSESLQFELKQFNIKIKLIEPGPIKTDFYGRSMAITTKDSLGPYNSLIKTVLPKMSGDNVNGASPELVAKTIFKAASDNSSKMRYVPDRTARQLLFAHSILPDRVYQWVVGKVLIG